MKFFMLLFLIASVASAQSIEDAVLQTPLVPPHRPGAELSSLPMWPAKFAKNRRVKRDDQGVVYDTTNHHDRFGFRTNGPPQEISVRKKHLFITGCSLAYGLGVEDQETFAALLADRLPDYRVVNMSVVGGSPAELLYLWKNFSFEEVYPEKEGVLIFNVLANHANRLKRTWQYLGWAYPFSPVFDEKLESTTVLSERWDFSWAKNMRKLGIEYYWLRLVSHFDSISPQEFNDLMIPYLVRSKEVYLNRFPKGRFVVTWFGHDTPTFNKESVPDFLDALKKAGIEYWEPNTPASLKRSDYMIPRDNHPNARAHREQADFLARQL